ncbi:MAG: ribulokinase [Actinomycetota bacterium]|nr:ribulokinase [Actinomycetota bacterium]
MPCALGVDVGTTNLKVALVRDDATVLGAAQRALPIERGPDTATQDAAAMWDELVDAVQEVTTANPEAAADVVAMSVCSQYSSIVPIDANGVPVAPMLMWQDQRGTDHSFDIMSRDEGAFMTFLERHGIPPIGSGLSLGHILYLQLDRPEVHAATNAYVEAMDYVSARLTGHITASQHTSFMVQLCDNRSLGATSYDDELVQLSGVDTTRLPPLVTVDATIGSLLPPIAKLLGLPESVVVYAPTNDTAAVAIATGAFTVGRAGLAIGTTSVLVDAVADFRTDLEHQILSMPGPYVDRYVVCAENGLGGKVLEHMLERVVYATDDLADHRVPDPFASLDAVLDATDPGAGGVLFLPWLGGSHAPTASGTMRGGFVNMSLETGRAELVRAVVEGVAHNLAWLLPHVETFTGESIGDVAFVGGAARSARWCQVLADVLGRPIAPLEAPEVGVARAMGLLALERNGVLSRDDLDRAAATTSTRFEPDPARHERYAYRQVQFEAAYAALLPISEALA